MLVSMNTGENIQLSLRAKPVLAVLAIISRADHGAHLHVRHRFVPGPSYCILHAATMLWP